MPTYEVQAPDGRTLSIEGPTPPSENALKAIFSSLPQPQAQPQAPPQQGGRTWTDTAIDAFPMVGGIVGGLAGSAAGPVGAVGGAALGGAAGESYKQLAKRFLGKVAPSTMTEAMTEIGKEGALQAGSEALGIGVAKGATKAAGAVYRGYLKPSLSDRLAPKANEIVKTALNEALPISRSGAQTANRVISELRQQVDDILENAPGEVDLHEIAGKVRSFARKRYFKPGVDLGDFKAAMDVAEKLDSHPSLGLSQRVQEGNAAVPLRKANEIKRALDTSVKETGFGVATGAKKSAEKHARFVINEQLRKKAAEIAPLNDRESKLIDAAKAISKAVEREANQNQLYGVKTLSSAALGAGAMGSGADPFTATAAAMAARIGFHPAVASRAAILAHKFGKELGVSAGTAARLAINTVMSSESTSGESAE